MREDHSDGRLLSRPASAPADPPWPPGLRPLPGRALLLVPDREAPQELLVYFHGAQGRAVDGLALFQPFVERGLLVVLASSLRSSWDLVHGRLGPDVAALDAVLSELMARYDVRRTALAGFSDGASYALTLGLANGDLVEHVLAFSPGYVGKLPAVGSPGVWVSHGTHDRVLPIEVCGRRIAGRLRDEGYEVRYVEFGGGHVLRPEDVAAAVDSWLTDRTTSSSRPSA